MTINTGSYGFDKFASQDTELKILERQAALAVAMEQEVWREAGLRPDMDVLDMGCGSGATTGLMAAYASSGSVLGVDSSETLIAEANAMQTVQAINNLQFMTGDVYSFHLPERKFDFIYSRLLFQHLSEPAKALRNMKRMLKPGGIMCIVDIDDSWLILEPETEEAKSLICRSVKSQAKDGGDRKIGRKLPHYLHSAGLREINSRIKTISSFDVGLEMFLKTAFDFRVERLPDTETEQAKRELEQIYQDSKTGFTWGAFGVFVATGVNNINEDAAMTLNAETLLETATQIIQDGNIVCCPSLGEYPVYDDLLYSMMCEDSIRMDAYRNAIAKAVKDKVVVEIGTGSEAPLAIMCAMAGAKKVYAIEGSVEAAAKATQLIKSKNLDDIIEVVTGYSSTVELPEKADICVSEIIGNIGGSEGAISIINDSMRCLKADGHILPERCVTRIAPVFMPENTYTNPLIDEVLDAYIQQVYQTMKCEFPITRYAVYNFPESSLIAEPEIFEDIDFNLEPTNNITRTVEFKIAEECRFDGLLLWVNLFVDQDNVIDTFKSASWAPVYLKAGNFKLKKDDIIKVECVRRLSKNLINPDYFFYGTIFRGENELEKFSIESYYTTA